MQDYHYLYSAKPGGANFGPNIRSLQGPRREKHDNFVRFFQKRPNVFFELGSNIHLRFVQERTDASGATSLAIWRATGVLASMANENQPYIVW